ncbi:MAG: hypothetical protein ACODAD_04445, partial [Planctomycetota bacterium]
MSVHGNSWPAALRNWSHAVALACCALSLCLVKVGLGGEGGNVLADAQIEQAGNEVRAGLEHTDEFIEKGRWDDAVETLFRIVENHGDALIEVPVSGGASELGFAKFIRLSEYCQRKVASWHTEAPEALAASRRRMDQLAHQWYQQAIDTGNESSLHRIVDELLLSSHGDQALLRLGELMLERGNHRLARHYWESLSPRLRVPAAVAEVLECRPGCDWWTALRRRPLDSAWPKI